MVVSNAVISTSLRLRITCNAQALSFPLLHESQALGLGVTLKLFRVEEVLGAHFAEIVEVGLPVPDDAQWGLAGF